MKMAIGDSKKMRKNKNRNRSKEQHEVKNSNQNEIFPVEKEEKKKKNKRMNVELKRSKDEADISDLSYSTDQMETNGRGNKKKRSLKNKKKTENDDSSEKETVILDQPNEIEGGFCQEDSDANEIEENKDKSKRKKRKSEKAEADSDANEVEEKQKGKSRKKRKSEKAEADSDANEVEENQKGKSRKKRKSEKKTNTGGVARPYIDAENTSEQENGKSRKTEGYPQPNAEENFRGKSGEAEDVYELSSGDEDASKGMRKWVTEYYQSRPGLQILQEKIDEYIVAYEAERERERKEKEARIAEDGWTVVVHNKGRKKTTDSETGIAVGSVSQAAVIDNMAKKKTKDIGLDFYRFQKREAKRNEIMELQSKFEQDKKRAQQLRAARKFRPL